MSIVEGFQSDIEYVDVNALFEETLKGELNQDTAEKTFGRFCTYNLGMTAFWLTGFKLYPDQRLILKGWMAKNYSLTVAGRGYSKSWLFSHFCYLYCLCNPGKTIVMIAPTFRSSRKIVENIERWAKTKRGHMLKQCITTTRQGEIVSKKPDLYEINFKNGSKIIALPLGDAEKLRGYRASVLGIDEGLLVSQNTIDTVLKPFIIAVAEDELTRRHTIREREDALIKKGFLKEKDRTKFLSNVKMIILSSASYAWQDLFTLYKKYLKIIYAQDEKMVKKLDEKERAKLLEDKEAKAEVIDGDDVPASYLVHQFSYKVAPWDRIEATVRQEIESGMIAEAVMQREYNAQFVQDSAGYFRAKTMDECTFTGENDPSIEIVGTKDGSEYVLAIDPNLGESEINDHFAMCLLKIITKSFSDGSKRKCGLVVHQYANAGAKPEHHIAYLLYLLTHFNIVYIAVDTSQGANMGFINFCNESMQFKTAKINLKPIEHADFGKESFEDLAKDIRRGYNRLERAIVQNQSFHSTFQRAANEYMQTCFNRRVLLFAAKVIENDAALAILRGQDVGSIIDVHPDFMGPEDENHQPQHGNIDGLIEQQDLLIDLVKKECTLIDPKMSSLGNMTFDLPSHVKKGSKSKSRIRKDNYSALFLGNWALKLYLDSLELPDEHADEYLATWSIGRK